jgi:hypothetical protein
VCVTCVSRCQEPIEAARPCPVDQSHLSVKLANDARPKGSVLRVMWSHSNCDSDEGVDMAPFAKSDRDSDS